MKKQSQEGITVKKSENFSEWYSQIIQKAEIVDLRLGTKGFIIIRPWGTLTIENMYDLYEEELQKKGHKPVIMPSVIPESNLKKESSHVKGFTPEVFWLETDKDEERLALRPTSETVFTPMFSYWVRSHRDLPMKLYQRGSVFRYDTKATRPLIRGREFNWIEAHNAFATQEEAEAQVQEDIEITETVMHGKFGVPFLAMKRPQWDKFAGAEYTIGSDVMMPDGKLIQQPSTHYMGQIFSKAFEAKFTNKNEKEEYLYTTAYGPAISRILVSVISTHGDDKGLVLPYCISPLKVVVVPIYNKKNKDKVMKYVSSVEKKLNVSYEVDSREDYSPGWKFNEYEVQGVPVRLALGPRDVQNGTVEVARRDNGEKETVEQTGLVAHIQETLEAVQNGLFERALKMREDMTTSVDSYDDFKSVLDEKGGFIRMHWDGSDETELQIKNETKATIRCIPIEGYEEEGVDPVSGKPSKGRVYFARSY